MKNSKALLGGSGRSSEGPSVVFFNDVVGWGGTERYLHILARGLIRSGVDVRVVVPAPRPGRGDLNRFVARFREAAVPVSVVPRPRTNLGRFMWAWRLFRRLAREAGGRSVLHFNQAVPGAYSLEIIGARLAGMRPLVTTNHLPVLGASTRPLRRIVSRLAVRCLDLTIVESEANRELAIAHGLAESDKIAVVVHGVVLRDIREQAWGALSKEQLGLRDSTFLIGSVGRLTPQKAFHHLVEAVRVMLTKGAKDVSLVIIGEGPERPALEHLIDRLGLHGNVRLLGHRDDAYRLLQVIDVFALASDFEGLPLAILEAMAAGKPIVATDVGGVRDAVTHAETGLLVPRGDTGALSRALATLAEDPGLREEMGDRAALVASQEFDSGRMVAETWKAYAVAAGRSDRTPSG